MMLHILHWIWVRVETIATYLALAPVLFLAYIFYDDGMLGFGMVFMLFLIWLFLFAVVMAFISFVYHIVTDAEFQGYVIMALIYALIFFAVVWLIGNSGGSGCGGRFMDDAGGC